MATTFPAGGVGAAQLPQVATSALPRTLFVKGLAKGATERHLHAIFSPFGNITDCQIARHRSGRSAGFAIVTFLRHEEAALAMQHIDTLVFLGRKLSCKWFSPERVLGATTGGVQASPFGASLQNLCASDLLALAQLLDQPNAALHEALPAQPLLPGAVAGVQQPTWSNMVSSWLNDYVVHQQDAALPAPLPGVDVPPEASTCVVTANRIRPGVDAAAAPKTVARLDMDLARLTLGLDATAAVVPATATAKPVPAGEAGHAEAAAPCSTAPASVADDCSSETASTHTAITASDMLDNASAIVTTGAVPAIIAPTPKAAPACTPGSAPTAGGPVAGDDLVASLFPSCGNATGALADMLRAKSLTPPAEGVVDQPALQAAKRRDSSIDPGGQLSKAVAAAAAAVQAQVQAQAAAQAQARRVASQMHGHQPRLMMGPMARAQLHLPGSMMPPQRRHAGGQGPAPFPGVGAGVANLDLASLQALQVQAALASHANLNANLSTINAAQQKYTDVLTQLAAQRVMAAASALPQMAACAPLAGAHMASGAGMPMMMPGMSMVPQQAGIPDINTLMMMNAAAGIRPMF